MKVSIITSLLQPGSHHSWSTESVLEQDYPDIEYIVYWTERRKILARWLSSMNIKTG